MTFSEHRRTEMGMATAFSLIPGILWRGKIAKFHFLAQPSAVIVVGNLTAEDATLRKILPVFSSVYIQTPYNT